MLQGARGDGKIPLQEIMQRWRWSSLLQDAKVLPEEGHRGLLGVRRIRDLRKAGLPQTCPRRSPHQKPENAQKERRQCLPRGDEILVALSGQHLAIPSPFLKGVSGIT